MDDRTLVSRHHLHQAAAELNALPQGAMPPPLEHEPLLRRLLHDQFAKIAGCLALHSAPPGLIRCVMKDIDRFLAFALTVQQVAYRGLLAGMVADDASPKGAKESGDDGVEGVVRLHTGGYDAVEIHFTVDADDDDVDNNCDGDANDDNAGDDGTATGAQS